MNDRQSRRNILLEGAADHVLASGLAAASLRPLAAALGTSDRMLLYYFKDKDELLAATLATIVDRLTRLLAAAGATTGPLPFAQLLATLWPAFQSPQLRPYLALWQELVALSARDQEPFRTIAGHIADTFLEWTEVRLDVADQGERRSQAVFLLAIIDGFGEIAAVGRAPLANGAFEHLHRSMNFTSCLKEP